MYFHLFQWITSFVILAELVMENWTVTADNSSGDLSMKCNHTKMAGLLSFFSVTPLDSLSLFAIAVRAQF